LEYIAGFYPAGGRPAKRQAQILRSLILFVLLFNQTKAGTSLTSWVRDVLLNSISLAVLIGCSCVVELPPLGSYYGFMDRFWLGQRDAYSRASLLPVGKNGKKPKKIIGPDGKLVEPEDTCTVTAKEIVNDILDGKPASDNPEAALQKIFSILAVFPSIRLGLVDPSRAASLSISISVSSASSLSTSQTSFEPAFSCNPAFDCSVACRILKVHKIILFATSRTRNKSNVFAFFLLTYRNAL